MRPRSHTLEDESRRAFAAMLPSEWVIRSLASDYGIDDQIEVFGKDGNATGLIFLAQVKATDTSDVESALKVSLRVDSLSYYRSLETPVMLVSFHAPTKKFYWRWIHEFSEYARPGQSTITLNIPCSAEWSEKTIEEIPISLQMFRRLKSPACPHPIRFSLVLPDAEVSGTSSPLLRTAIQDVANSLAGLVQFSDVVPVGAHPSVSISNEILAVSLAGLKSFTWRFEQPYPKALITTTLPHDVLTAVAFVLAKAGHSSEASEIASSHLGQSTLTESADVFFELLGAMARSRRALDALRLARKLIPSAAGPLLAQWLTIVATAHIECLQDSELEYFQGVMRLTIERAAELGDARLLSASHYNFGNHLRNQSGIFLRSAFTHYRLAAKSEPGYRGRPYFWKEVAGILHQSGHFRWAATAYQKAFQIGGEASCLALRADSTMSAGRFRDALKLFEEYMTLEEKPNEEWHLKNFMVSHLDKLDIGTQDRNPVRAIEMCNVTSTDESQTLTKLQEAVRVDALCSLAWFNLGASFGRAARAQEAFESYLFAGVCCGLDVEAWTRALLHGLAVLRDNSINVPLIVCIVRVAYRRNGQKFLEELRKRLDQQDPAFPVAALIGIVADAVKDIDRRNRLTEVRMLGKGADYEVILRAPTAVGE